MKYTIVVSTVLAVMGVILVAGSSHMVPYTVGEYVRVDKSRKWIDDTFLLRPESNITYVLDSITQNHSIFQMDLKPSLPMVFRIIDDNNDELVFEWLRGGTIFWAPPSLSGNWRFVFKNPSSAEMGVSVTVREYYLKITEYREDTYYRSLFDPVYGHVGIILIIAGTAMNVMYVLYQEANKWIHKIRSEFDQYEIERLMRML